MKISRISTAAAAAASITVTGCTAAALAGTPAAASHRKAPVCADSQLADGVQRYTVTGRRSLVAWAAGRRQGVTASFILGATWACGPGWQQARFAAYLDRGDLNAPLPRGTWLWSLKPGYRN